jgi:hypothetical protein
MEQVCKRCNDPKPIEAFYVDGRTGKPRRVCSECLVKQASINAKKNRERINAKRRALPVAIKREMSRQLGKWRRSKGLKNFSVLLLTADIEAIKQAARRAGMRIRTYVVQRCLG